MVSKPVRSPTSLRAAVRGRLDQGSKTSGQIQLTRTIISSKGRSHSPAREPANNERSSPPSFVQRVHQLLQRPQSADFGRELLHFQDRCKCVVVAHRRGFHDGDCLRLTLLAPALSAEGLALDDIEEAARYLTPFSPSAATASLALILGFALRRSRIA
jgi:hypothetical protein